MSPLATYLVYAAVALPLVLAATWSVHRHGAALLFDLIDADEMVVAATHRLITAGHLLVGLALAAALAPSTTPGHADGASAVLSAAAGLLTLLAIGHLGLVSLYLRARHLRTVRDFGPPRWYAGAVQIPGATPPIVPLPVGPPPAVVVSPPHAPIPIPMPIAPAPRAFYPPSPPPWCRPLPLDYDAWAPPQH